MPPPLALQILGQAAADLVEDQADQRLGAADVGGRHDEVERRRPRSADEVGDAPVAAARHLGDDGIAIEAEEGHGGRQHARALVVGFVEQLARREATTGCGPASPRCGVVIIAASVDSIGRFGSDRKAATPASVLSASA